MIPYFDAHCDTLDKTAELFCNGCVNDLEGESFSPRAQIYAVYGDISKGRIPRRKLEAAAEALERSKAVFYKKLPLPRELSSPAALLSIEGADVGGCSPDGLAQAAAKGGSVTGITWNRANLLSG